MRMLDAREGRACIGRMHEENCVATCMDCGIEVLLYVIRGCKLNRDFIRVPMWRWNV